MEQNLSSCYDAAKEYESEEFAACYKEFLQKDVKLPDVFLLESQQKIYDRGELSGTKFLDFGAGPGVHRIALASAHFSDITLAEWSGANRREVEKWLRGDKDALDWTPSLEICARVEGYRDWDEGVAKIEERIRKAVKKVIPCDALANHILPTAPLEEFDVINSCYCLECCCLTQDLFKEGMKKLSGHLRKGGALVMATILEGKEYSAHKPLPCSFITEAVIKEALTEAGLELRDWFVWKDSKSYDSLVHGGRAIYYSVKI